MTAKQSLDTQIPLMQEEAQVSRRIIKSLKAKSDAKRTISEQLADWISAAFGSIPFLLINTVWFIVWILINIDVVPSIKPFDPFPFGFLTMIVSLEAIILSVFVLISQNRSSRVDELREEIDLQVDIIAEEEITKMLQIVVLIAQKSGIDLSKDESLKNMLRPIEKERIEKSLEKQISS